MAVRITKNGPQSYDPGTKFKKKSSIEEEPETPKAIPYSAD